MGGYLETQGSGGMGACMLRVSRRLVWPLTLMVSNLRIGGQLGSGGEEGEVRTQTLVPAERTGLAWRASNPLGPKSSVSQAQLNMSIREDRV